MRFWTCMLEMRSFQSSSIHLVLAILGRTVSIFFYTLELLLVFNIVDIATFVLKSTVKRIEQVCITIILALMLVFIYTIIIGEHFASNVFITDAFNGNDFCQTVRECFTQLVNYGLLHGGGIGDAIVLPRMSDNAYFGRWITNITFFIFVNLICLQIIFGIIIDTFSQMRDEKAERDDDFNNICFVCGLTRADFENCKKNFDVHVKMEHNKWSYIYYVIYLENIDENEITPLEKWVLRQKMWYQVDWVPQRKSEYLGNNFFLFIFRDFS